MKTKHFELCTIISLGLFLICNVTGAKTVKSLIVEDGGTGPFKAEVVQDKGLMNYTIVRPADMEAAYKANGELPVILFGNGGCSRNPWGFLSFLTEISSHGYVVVSDAIWISEAPKPEASKPMSREEMLEMFKTVEAQNRQNALNMFDALNWLEAEKADKRSEYYSMIDCSNVAAMGQSCGGLQALILGTAGDERIKTTVVLNSGVTSPGDGLSGMVAKSDLQKLTHPIIYIVGGRSDMAYSNAADDFKLISHVPVSLASLEVGHGGTYSRPHGGAFSVMALQWLDYQLKNKMENEDIFRYCQRTKEIEKWRLSSKNYDKQESIKLYAVRPAESEPTEEVAAYNDLGEVVNYSRISDPSMQVCLPDPDKANGAAVLIFPGGSLMSLTWDTEFRQIANYLNSKGIAAIGVKYRLRTSFPRRPQAVTGATPPSEPTRFQQGRGRIIDFAELTKANCNPGAPNPEDKSVDYAAADALRAMEIVGENADKWHIDKNKIGWMGFSAGGGVELAAMLKADETTMPDFLCSVYGPSLMEMDVPANAPELFIAVHADHPNVAAGCMALFMEWKKAGKDAEIHVYGQSTGGFYGGAGSQPDKNTLNGWWLETYYSWLVAKGFAGQL